MKIAIVEKNNVSEPVIELIKRLVGMIAWPDTRLAMADVTKTLLESKPRVAESVFGWGRDNVTLGMNELRTGIICKNDLSKRCKPKSEEKNPKLLEDIHTIMDPKSHADPSMRSNLAYTHLSAAAVRLALIEKGWGPMDLPEIRALSNVLNRNGYRLRSVTKSRVKKKRT
jgi:hypothetical protein